MLINNVLKKRTLKNRLQTSFVVHDITQLVTITTQNGGIINTLITLKQINLVLILTIITKQ